MTIGEFIKRRRKELKLTLEDIGNATGVGKSTVRKWENDLISNMRRDKIDKLSQILEVSPTVFLNDCIDDYDEAIRSGRQRLVDSIIVNRTTPQVRKLLEEKYPNDIEKQASLCFNLITNALLQDFQDKLDFPDVFDDPVSFPVIGDVAAGYDHIAIEDWEGETIDIPSSFIKTQNKEDYFVLSVAGDSMYPIYQNGDYLLVRRQLEMDYSGQIGVVLYDDEKATVKKVEFDQSKQWRKLVPINPNFKPMTIRGVDLESCRILGVPVYLIRKIYN